MPVIAFANSKGGSGKTTTALLLACHLARARQVTIIDGDPRQPITSWAAKQDVPKNLTVIGHVTEDNIQQTIEEAAIKDPFVIVDLEGTASKLMAYAIGQSDYIVIPCKEQQQDAEAAVQVIRAMQRDFKMMGRSVPFAILFTMTKWVKGRASKSIIEQFKSSTVPVFSAEITERDAFSQIFLRGGTIYDLKGTSNNLEKAIENIEQFTAELLTKIKNQAKAQS